MWLVINRDGDGIPSKASFFSSRRRVASARSRMRCSSVSNDGDAVSSSGSPARKDSQNHKRLKRGGFQP